MADFSSSIKKIIPTTGETKVLLGWGLATTVLFVLQYVVFAFVTGSGVSTKRLPVLRIVSLGAVAYAVLMIRDLIAYYAGVAVDEMFSMSPVVIFGVLVFMTGFLIYGLHDIQDIGSSVAISSEKSGGNVLSFFFENDEGFEDDEEEKPQKKQQLAHRDQSIIQQPPMQLQPADQGGVSQYGMSSDPFTNSSNLPTSTRDKQRNQQDIDPRGSVGNSNQMLGGGAYQAPLMAASMGGSSMAGGSAYAAF